ncbi:MAG: thiamine-phosphate kinase [Bradymonadaceae bacterium]
MYREFDLIDRIHEVFSVPEGVTVGIGDDCAVLDPGRFDLVTTDTVVEGVHFRRDFSSAEEIGWKALAVCLSDIAAMGGGPGAFFLNLVLGPNDDEAFVDGLIAGMKAASDELAPRSFEVGAAGGDTTSTKGPTVISITLMGEASPAGAVLRSGAVPGDRVILLGPTGLAAAGLAILEGDLDVDPTDFEELLAAHRRPRPRSKEGALLGLYGIPSAMVDISDGLGQDLGHILERSKVGAWIHTHNIPIHPALARLGEETGVDVFPFVIGGGDDYELLMTVPPSRMPKLWDLARRYEWDIHDIGEIRSPTEGLNIVDVHGTSIDIPSMGYQHFEGS